MKPLLYLLLLLPFASGNNHQADITSDWCRMNLKGEVKEMKKKGAYTKKELRKKWYSFHETYSFLEDGFINYIVYDYEHLLTFSYINNQNKELGHNSVFYYKFTPYHLGDSTITVGINDTSFIQHTYRLNLFMNGFNGPTCTRYDFHSKNKYIYNSKAQLIEKTIRTEEDIWSSTSTYYNYSDNGYVSKKVVIDLHNKDTTITNIIIKKVDKKGNPTRTIEYVSGSYEDTMIYNYEYTYY